MADEQVTDPINLNDYFAIDYFEFADKNTALQTLYFLLNGANTLIQQYLKNHENRDFLLKGFTDKCQRAIEWLKEEKVENPKGWTDYVNGVNQWFQTTIQNGVSDSLEYIRLHNTLDGLCLQETIFSGKPEKALKSETMENGIEYIAINIATRTITFGAKPIVITSERIWNFIKDVVSAAKYDRFVPLIEGAQKNKNNIDQLRRKVGKDNLKKLVISAGDGYKLSPNVKVLNSGQVGIRKTKLKRQRAT
jgi:hypothetical protein